MLEIDIKYYIALWEHVTKETVPYTLAHYYVIYTINL